MRRKLRAGLRLAAVAAAGCVLAPAASADDCNTGACGPTLANGYGHQADCTAGHFGQKIYPVFESRYIKQFCGPTASPNSCFGYFKPQITPWGQACPLYADPAAAVAYGPTSPVTPAVIPPAATTPATPAPTTPVTPAPQPRATDRGQLPTIPIVPAPDPVRPGKLPKPPTGPLVPPKLEPSAQGLTLPPVAEFSVSPTASPLWVPVSGAVKK